MVSRRASSGAVGGTALSYQLSALSPRRPLRGRSVGLQPGVGSWLVLALPLAGMLGRVALFLGQNEIHRECCPTDSRELTVPHHPISSSS